MNIVVAMLVLTGLLIGGIWMIWRSFKNTMGRMGAFCLLPSALWLFWPALAFAADAAATSPVQDVLTALMQLVALVLAGLIAWAVKLLADKFKVTISADQQAMLQSAAKSAVFYAEEWAAKKVNLSQTAATGSDKLSAAIAFVTSKLPGVDPTEASDAIHAVLGSIQGLGASGAVGEKQ